MKPYTLKELLKRDCVSFAEIARLPGAKGPLAIYAGGKDCSNIVIWSGLSQAIIDEIEGLRAAGVIEFKNASLLTYAIDGQYLGLPLAKRRTHYRVPHWAPTYLKVKIPTALEAT